jgi:hypothetical protein
MASLTVGKERSISSAALATVTMGAPGSARSSRSVPEFRCPRHSVGNQPHALRAAFRIPEPVLCELEDVAVAAGIVLTETVSWASTSRCRRVRPCKKYVPTRSTCRSG